MSPPPGVSLYRWRGELNTEMKEEHELESPLKCLYQTNHFSYPSAFNGIIADLTWEFRKALLITPESGECKGNSTSRWNALSFKPYLCLSVSSLCPCTPASGEYTDIPSSRWNSWSYKNLLFLAVSSSNPESPSRAPSSNSKVLALLSIRPFNLPCRPSFCPHLG